MDDSEDSVVGTYRPDKDDGEPRDHHEGWEQAMEDALVKAGRRWGPGKYPRVTVTFEAEVEVTNPAGVGEYRVVLKK